MSDVANGSVYSADGTVKGSAGVVHMLEIIPNSAIGTVILRDGGSAGTQRWKAQTGAIDEESRVITFHPGLSFGTDIYVDVTDCTVSVLFT